MSQSHRDVVSLLDGLTPAEIEALVADLEPGQLEAIDAVLQDGLLAGALPVLAQEFSESGFAAFFHYFNGFPLHKEGKKWVKKIFQAWNGDRKLLQKAFRGSGKTTVFSKYFLLFFVGHHPHTTNMVIRISQSKARETAAAVARIIDIDPRWRKVFPGVVPDKKSGWGVETGYFLRRTDLAAGEEENEEAWQILQSRTGRPTGPTLIGYGYTEDAIIGSRVNGILQVDDLHDMKNTRSATLLEDVKIFIKQTLLPIPVPGETLEIWCYTRWTSNDAYGDREDTGLYLESVSPVMVETTADDPEGVYFPEEDERLPAPFPYGGRHWRLAWPERWDYDAILLKYIDIGPISFALMYMLDIEASKGIVLLDEWLHPYPAGDIQREWKVIMGVDYASTADKIKAARDERDYFALAVMRVNPAGGLILVDGYRGRVSRPEALDKVAAFWAAWPTAIVVGVESLGKGEEFYNDMVLMNEKRTGGRPIVVQKVTHQRRGKGERFENWLAPRFAAARIWVSSVENEFITHFRDEWLSYPRGVHDDCVDAVYMAAFAGNAFLPAVGSKVDKTAEEIALEKDPVYQTVKKNAKKNKGLRAPRLRIQSPRRRLQQKRRQLRREHAEIR